MAATQTQLNNWGVREPLFFIAGAGVFAVFASLILGGIIHPYLGILFFLVLIGLLIFATVQLFVARGKAIRDGEASLWKGLVKILSWNPTEGVLFLKNKQIDFVDDNPLDGGGIRAIYPLLGQEMVVKIPLEIQTLAFKDSEVLTLEYMPLTVQGMLYWRVTDLSKFYLYISKEIHSANDTGGHSKGAFGARSQFEVAEQWLRSMAESKTRAVVSRTGTGLLIADQLASDLPKILPESSDFLRPLPAASSSYRSATDGLAEVIKNEFASTANEYGLEIHRIGLQEVKLPAEIYAAAIDACKSSYLPLKAQAEAAERRLKLQAEVDVIGAEATGLKEIARNIPALAFQDFLAPLFIEFNRKRSLGATNSM